VFQNINAADFVIAPLSNPAGFAGEELVIERIVGDLYWGIATTTPSFQVADLLQFGIIVIPINMYAASVVVQPFGPDCDLEWLWSHYACGVFLNGAIGDGVETGYLRHVHLDTGARRRFNPSAEVLCMYGVNGGVNPVQFSIGTRWLASWA